MHLTNFMTDTSQLNSTSIAVKASEDPIFSREKNHDYCSRCTGSIYLVSYSGFTPNFSSESARAFYQTDKLTSFAVIVPTKNNR